MSVEILHRVIDIQYRLETIEKFLTNNSMKVKIKKLSPQAVTPKKATVGAAAYDVYAPRDIILCQGRQVIPLDIAIDLPFGYEAKIEPRSGYSAKGFAVNEGNHEIRVDADVITGKIDSDYRGNIGVIVLSRESSEYIIKAGQRIAQLTIYKVSDVEFIDAQELSNTDRNEGGFNSTGI